MNQHRTVELLKEVYQSAKTAMDAINILLSKTRSASFRNDLESQLDKYYEIASQANMQLSGFRELPDESSVFTKLGVWSAVQMNTITNQNTDHMAEIMINGSMMGVIDLTKFLRSYSDVDSYATDLAQQLINVEQANIDIMKNHL